MTNTLNMPDLLPPSEAASTQAATPGGSAPTLTEMEVAEFAAESAPAPTMAPPSAAAAGVEAAAAATWRSNVQIDALWSIDEVRNAWVHVVGVGWRKIYNGRDGAFQALVTLASQARQTNRPATLREEADGMIYAIYVW